MARPTDFRGDFGTGAVPVGKTHTVEMAYGAVGFNPHWGTPRNPFDEARVPGGSSCGAGVSLGEGSALIALGTDTGGSIRIPASVTGNVGLKLTKGRWSTDGVVPLSQTLDTVGGLTRTVEDQIFFFLALDPAAQRGERFAEAVCQRATEAASVFESRGVITLGKPSRGRAWAEASADVAAVVDRALDRLSSHTKVRVVDVDGDLLDRAQELYDTGGIAGAECRSVLESQLPGWLDLLHPTIRDRIELAPASLESPKYLESIRTQQALVDEVPSQLFCDGVDFVVLPTQLDTPPRLADVSDDLQAYVAANKRGLAPTCPASILGLCAISLPVGTDTSGMPVGLQILAPANHDWPLLQVARAIEHRLAEGSVKGII
mmetsp:Transcript_13802/g.41733  ORF Transcript_13802/g.41733 Transcript_13802/m.41733 type:complete len:375 (-) Transcript_13802:529-1653(-)